MKARETQPKGSKPYKTSHLCQNSWRWQAAELIRWDASHGRRNVPGGCVSATSPLRRCATHPYAFACRRAAPGAIAMASAGMGAAPMPRFLAQPGNPVVSWAPVSGLDFACEIVAAWRSDNANPCLGPFVGYIARPETIERMRAGWIPEP